MSLLPALSGSFEKKLKISGFLNPGEKVFVACSGGPDSVALFYLLLGLSKAWRLKLGLLHFNHGLRGVNALRDEKFVASLAKASGVTFVSGRGNVRALARREKLSLEEAARKARYDFFLREVSRRRISKIAFAHTLDDQAETVLMRMIQGTGIQGLQGIREARPLGNALLIRPLLSFSKEEILAYLKEQKIKFCRDETNRSGDFLRNRIRLKLFPMLKKQFNPRVKEALARIPAVVSDEASAIAEWETRVFPEVCLEISKKRILLSRKAFEKLPGAIQYRVLRRALEKLDARSGLPYEAWETFRGELKRKHYRHSFKRDLDLSLTPEKIMIYRKKAAG